jgi:hypothetical protein
VSELKLRQRFIKLGVPLRIGPADLAEARAEVEAVRAWLAEDEAAGYRSPVASLEAIL